MSSNARRSGEPPGSPEPPPLVRSADRQLRCRLAAIDLDGTLLRPDHSISERSRAALARARDAGIRVVLVTARGPRTVRVLAAEAGLDGSAICSNGAIALDLSSGQVVRTRTLAVEVAARLVRELRSRLPGILFAVESEEIALEPGFAAWGWEPPAGTRYADGLELVAEPVAKLIVRHEEHALEAVAEAARELAGDEAAVTIAGPWTVEIATAGVSKAAALAELCEELEIDQAAVVAFGDYPNDVPMLEWAGHAVAVANAHPDVLAVADEVTASNEEDGVALVLERLA
ncbi:MAG TPA: Cof-type HAD-IIB family hydrolase [Gaiellaceae bacterium]|nr:Cof-type HAD-IIB family hydrolase [Gaiellaceae bacterium]